MITDITPLLEDQKRLRSAATVGLLLVITSIIFAIGSAAVQLPVAAGTAALIALGLAVVTLRISRGDPVAVVLLAVLYSGTVVSGAVSLAHDTDWGSRDGPGTIGVLLVLLAWPLVFLCRAIGPALRYTRNLSQYYQSSPFHALPGASGFHRRTFPKMSARTRARLAVAFAYYGAGATILILTVLVSALIQNPYGIVMWLVLLALRPLFGAGGRAYHEARQLAQEDIQQVRELDSRPRVLLLRSFRDEHLSVDRKPKRRLLPFLAFLDDAYTPYRHGVPTLEEVIAAALWSHGPVIAIGMPGETVPPVGAAREYLTNDRWRQRVETYITEAALIVIVLGNTPGFEWECRTLAALGALHKVVVVFPPREDTLSRWQTFDEWAGTAQTDLLASVERGTYPLVVTSLSENPPHLVACRWRSAEAYELALGARSGFSRIGFVE